MPAGAGDYRADDPGGDRQVVIAPDRGIERSGDRGRGVAGVDGDGHQPVADVEVEHAGAGGRPGDGDGAGGGGTAGVVVQGADGKL